MDGRTTWGAITVAWARVAAAETASLPEAVGVSQAARLQRLTGMDAARFAAGRALIAALIGEIAGSDADLELTSACERCGGDHGRVRQRADRVVVSVAYAGDLVVVAAADAEQADAVGVDVERDDDTGAARAADLGRLFAPDPAPTLTEWTRVEAVLKADGRGLHVEPSAVRFSPRGDGFEARVDGDERVWDVVTLPAPAPGYVISVACGPSVRRGRSTR